MNLEPFCLDDSQDSRGTAAFHLIQEIVLSSNMFIPGSLQPSPIFFFFFLPLGAAEGHTDIIFKKNKKKNRLYIFLCKLEFPFCTMTM